MFLMSKMKHVVKYDVYLDIAYSVHSCYQIYFVGGRPRNRHTLVKCSTYALIDPTKLQTSNIRSLETEPIMSKLKGIDRIQALCFLRFLGQERYCTGSIDVITSQI